MKRQLLFTIASVFICASSFSQWSTITLSSGRFYASTAIYNDTLFTIGGAQNNVLQTTVDVYDLNTSSFANNMNISQPRGYSGVVAGDSALYIFGGVANLTSQPITGSNIVDIYSHGTWTTHQLPESVMVNSAVHVGSKVMFSGSLISMEFDASGAVPIFSDSIYIYDELSDEWSTYAISVPRSDIGVASDGNIAMFAGGYSGPNQVSDAIDIYNASTDSWSTATLSEARMQTGGTFCNGKFYFAGGRNINTESKVIDIYDGVNWSIDSLSTPRSAVTAMSVGDVVIFAGGGTLSLSDYLWNTYLDDVDVINTTTGYHSTNNLNITRANARGASTNSTAYVCSGTASPVVEVWDVPLLLTDFNLSEPTLYPNPATEWINIPDMNEAYLSYAIIDKTGRTVQYSETCPDIVNVSNLEKGIYIIQLELNDQIISKQFIKE